MGGDCGPWDTLGARYVPAVSETSHALPKSSRTGQRRVVERSPPPTASLRFFFVAPFTTTPRTHTVTYV